MRRLWLLFAQTVTVGLAVWFIVATLKPGWISHAGDGARTPVAAPATSAAPSASAASATYREGARHAMPAVVNIFTSKGAKPSRNPFMDDPFLRKFFGDRQGEQEDKQYSLGSGVIVNPNGYILTNNHVVEAADEIEIALADGRKVDAKLVGTDPETDLAVIKIDMKDLPSITFAPIDGVQVGDVVLAIGNPFGVGQTVTMGIVSALGRNHLGINTFENFIQTDAAINPGNSGGALVDVGGNLLGINTAIYSRTGGSLGIGFAIPASTAKTVMDAIIKNGRVVRGWIGVEPQDITPELADSFNLKRNSGAIIAGVLRNGPADRAGMRPGDILVEVNGRPVRDTTEMLNLIAQLEPGSKARMKVLRRSEEASLDIQVGTRPRQQREAE
ncbi:Do family serine endopeptidase [Noviherbaspirillum pedocola]|uniref:Do family serine endopeptidase n=1 Tax=Noviherbaspirillum pedocola TaxID=2801341 RepID=A0A934SQR0_9BURK|nr:Do family serine endopeptidase [Noviherbaspirillum pedocola]MBK4733777.1 Do family serine endopeptidase [Noviherbaspirillum pedocola]